MKALFFSKTNASKFSLSKLLPYECLKARHSCKAQGVMRAKPEMKPWVHADKSRMSSAGAALSAWAFVFVWSSAPLKGLNQYIDYYSPGLAPRARRRGGRPCRAHLRTHQSITLLFWSSCSGSKELFTLNQHTIYTLVILMRLLFIVHGWAV